MSKPDLRTSACCLLLLALQLSAAQSDFWLSERGLYKVSFESSLDPIEINRIHEWVLHVETAHGEAVDDAELTIEGGMPAHDHGLPTRPRVTEVLGNGDYRIQGMRFHMNGAWRIEVTIEVGEQVDRVAIDLQL